MTSRETNDSTPQGSVEHKRSKREFPCEPRPSLKTLFAAELFSKLPDEQQNIIIAHIMSFLDCNIK